MQITKTESIKWEFSDRSIPCYVCKDAQASHIIEMQIENVDGLRFPACNSCRQLDPDTIFDGLKNNRIV